MGPVNEKDAAHQKDAVLFQEQKTATRAEELTSTAFARNNSQPSRAARAALTKKQAKNASMITTANIIIKKQITSVEITSACLEHPVMLLQHNLAVESQHTSMDGNTDKAPLKKSMHSYNKEKPQANLQQLLQKTLQKEQDAVKTMIA